MIDTGEGPNWTPSVVQVASLFTLTDAELHSPFIVERICRWWGCSPEVALKAKGKELLRRTMTTERPA